MNVYEARGTKLYSKPMGRIFREDVFGVLVILCVPQQSMEMHVFKDQKSAHKNYCDYDCKPDGDRDCVLCWLYLKLCLQLWVSVLFSKWWAAFARTGFVTKKLLPTTNERFQKEREHIISRPPECGRFQSLQETLQLIYWNQHGILYHNNQIQVPPQYRTFKWSVGEFYLIVLR